MITLVTRISERAEESNRERRDGGGTSGACFRCSEKREKEMGNLTSEKTRSRDCRIVAEAAAVTAAAAARVIIIITTVCCSFSLSLSSFREVIYLSWLVAPRDTPAAKAGRKMVIASVEENWTNTLCSA